MDHQMVRHRDPPGDRGSTGVTRHDRSFTVLSIRAARRYRWRLAGGRLTAARGRVRFAPNRLERRRADTYWESTAEYITGVRVDGKVWLVVETVTGTETFRVFGAAAAASGLEEALGLAAPGGSVKSPQAAGGTGGRRQDPHGRLTTAAK
jgi:hypothetical protein